MEQILVTLRLDPDLRNETEHLFASKYRMSLNDAVVCFLRECALEGKMPFNISDVDANDCTLAAILAAHLEHNMEGPFEGKEKLMEALDEQS